MKPKDIWVYDGRDEMGRYLVTSKNRLWVMAQANDKSSAHLIAAAPELLDALEALLSAQPNEATTEPLSSAIVLASLAVQKAKGEK